MSLLSIVSRLCVSDLIDPNRSLAFTNPRLDTMVYLDAASTLVPLLVWAGVCTDVSTARHLCSEGIPHPHTGIPLRHAGLGRDPPSPTWDPFSVLPLFGRRPAVFCFLYFSFFFLFYVLARCARQSEPRLTTQWKGRETVGQKEGQGESWWKRQRELESGRESGTKCERGGGGEGETGKHGGERREEQRSRKRRPKEVGVGQIELARKRPRNPPSASGSEGGKEWSRKGQRGAEGEIERGTEEQRHRSQSVSCERG